MYGLTTFAVFHIALLTTSTGSQYQMAYNRAEEAGKPLLVLVGKDNCPNCRLMKQETMPELARTGKLKSVVFTAIDSEARPELTRQLLRGDSLPQLVLYTPVGKLWRRTHIAGPHPSQEILAYLDREIAKGIDVAETAKAKKTVEVSPNWTNVTYSSGGS